MKDGTKVTVTETHVYGVDSFPDGKGPEETGFEFHPGTPAPPGPDLVDYDIQDGPARLRLKENEGLISIAVQAGDSAIGDLYVNIQYEGPKGQPDLCMAGQNALLENAGDWLHKLLEELAPEDGGWRLRIDAQPCPKAKVALRLDRAVQRLENRGPGPVIVQTTLSTTREIQQKV
jgi:hypothetical protein